MGSGWVAHAERDGEALGPHTPFGHFGPVLGHFGPTSGRPTPKAVSSRNSPFVIPTALRERARFRARRTQKALFAVSAAYRNQRAQRGKDPVSKFDLPL